MDEYYTLSDIELSASVIREQTSLQPKVGLILGSGLNGLAESVEAEAVLPFAEIPEFPLPSVEGHVGKLLLGRLEDRPVVVMQGRAHYYEGYTMARLTLPVRVMQLLGIEVLIITNAAGGVNSAFSAGDVMLIRDHINLVGMAGLNPLRGPNLDVLGPRFPDMSQVYDIELMKLARREAARAKITLREGVYVCLAGPSYETPADVRFLRLIGVDAVGMSTVPEAIVARHGGTKVLAFSGISNVLPSEGGDAVATDHDEVLAAGAMLVPRLEKIVRGVLRSL